MSFWWGIWKPKGWRLGHEAHHFPLAVPDRKLFYGRDFIWCKKRRFLGVQIPNLRRCDWMSRESWSGILWLSAVLYATLRRSSLQVFPNDVRLNMAKKGVSKQTDWLGRNFPKSKLEICRDFIKDIPWKLRCQLTPGNSGTLCPFWDGEHVRSGDQVWSQLESPGTFQFLIS